MSTSNDTKTLIRASRAKVGGETLAAAIENYRDMMEQVGAPSSAPGRWFAEDVEIVQIDPGEDGSVDWVYCEIDAVWQDNAPEAEEEPRTDLSRRENNDTDDLFIAGGPLGLSFTAAPLEEGEQR